MKSRKIKQNHCAELYVQCRLKNTIFTLTNYKGKTIKQYSIKSIKKSETKRKNHPQNLQKLVKTISNYINNKQIEVISVIFKGIGVGRYNVIRFLFQRKLKYRLIIDRTSSPFNGCRPRAIRRK